MLHSLSNILDKGAEHARASKSDPAALVNARLAPDMYPLSQQVQIACDQASDATARLTGKDAPQFDNNEKTLDELKARIAKTIDYVQSVRETAFEGAEDRKIIIPIPEDNMEFEMNGLQFLTGLGVATISIFTSSPHTTSCATTVSTSANAIT